MLAAFTLVYLEKFFRKICPDVYKRQQKGVGLIQTMVQQSQAFNITRENYLRVLGNARCV